MVAGCGLMDFDLISADARENLYKFQEARIRATVHNIAPWTSSEFPEGISQGTDLWSKYSVPTDKCLEPHTICSFYAVVTDVVRSDDYQCDGGIVGSMVVLIHDNLFDFDGDYCGPVRCSENKGVEFEYAVLIPCDEVGNDAPLGSRLTLISNDLSSDEDDRLAGTYVGFLERRIQDYDLCLQAPEFITLPIEWKFLSKTDYPMGYGSKSDICIEEQ